MKKDKFNVYRPINLGTGLCTAEQFCAAFKEKGSCTIDDQACKLMMNPGFRVSDTPKTLNLVEFPIGYFNHMDDYVPIVDLYRWISNHDRLGFCPAEVGPQLCLQYAGIPVAGNSLIGMAPISDGVGNVRMLTVTAGVGSSNHVHLGAVHRGPHNDMRGSDTLILVLLE